MENIPTDPIPINDSFTNEKLCSIKVASPWFADFANYIVWKVIPPHFT
jgi:hypothetical protein